MEILWLILGILIGLNIAMLWGEWNKEREK